MSTSRFDLGIASLSLGDCQYHSFPAKLAAASRAGFTSIEIFDLDWAAWLESYTEEHGLEPSSETSQRAAKSLCALVKSHGMRISCWQPLRAFEGWLNEDDRAAASNHAESILALLPALETDLLIVCTTTTGAPRTTGDLDRCAEDLAWLADKAAAMSPPVRIAYEGLSFGAHRRSWKDAWEVIRAADRPNLGICLDSFNSLAYEWADPYSTSGRREDIDVDGRLRDSMYDLVTTIPGHRIFIVQVADGQRMTPPMTPPEDPTIPPLRPWSRGHRLFPLETDRGAYLPVQTFARAAACTGYRGPWSLEVFNNSLHDPDEAVPYSHAQRGYHGLTALLHKISPQDSSLLTKVPSKCPTTVRSLTPDNNVSVVLSPATTCA